MVKTRETLDNFDASRARHRTDKGRRSEHSFDGRPALWFERIQMHRGQTRHDIIVVDCGQCRAVLVLGS